MSNVYCSVDGYLNLTSTNSPWYTSTINHKNDTVSPSTSSVMTSPMRDNVPNNDSENTVVFSIGPVDFNETTILFAAVVLLIVLLCCVTLILCRVCCTKKEHGINNKNELKMKDIHIKGNKPKQNSISNNNSNNYKVNNNNGLSKLSNERKPSLEIVFNDSEPDINNIALPKVNVHSLIVASAKESINNDSIDNSDLDAGIEELFGDHEYTIEGEKDAHISQSNFNSKKTALSPTRSKSSNSKRSVLHVRNQPNYTMDTSGIVSIPYDNIDESNYQEWSEKQVLIWFKKVLSAHNVEKQLISSFLKELSAKCVTGKKLDQFKNNNEMLLAFQSQFSTKHRAFAMWLALQTAIDDLGSSKQ